MGLIGFDHVLDQIDAIAQQHNTLWGKADLAQRDVIDAIKDIRDRVTNPSNFDLDLSDLDLTLPSGWDANYQEPDFPTIPSAGSEPAAPTLTWAYQQGDGYASQLKERMTDKLRDLLNGDVLLPSAYFDTLQDELEADAARGFRSLALDAANACGTLSELPGEALASRISKGQIAYRQALQTAGLKAKQQRAETWRADLLTAFERGQALDQLWAGIQDADLRRELAAETARYQGELAKYGAGYEALAKWAQAGLTAIQRAFALPELQIRSEQVRLSTGDRTLDLATRAAQVQLQGQLARLQLYQDRLKHVDNQVQRGLESVLNGFANVMTALMSAAQTHLSGSASESYSASNSASGTI